MGETTGIEWTHHIKTRTGRRLGALKSAATKTGLSLQDWAARRDAGRRWCWECRTWKLEAVFTVDNTRWDRRASRCKECMSHASTASRYGVSKATVRESRCAPCAICGRTQAMHIDHDHANGKVRGYLCSRCNVGLGQFLDNPDLLRKATTYLEMGGEVHG